MIIAKRYAEGFLEYARETIGFEKGIEELKGIRAVLRDNPDFFDLLENPALTYREKNSAIDDVLGGRFSPQTCDFLKLVLKKGRLDMFSDMAEYARIKYARGKETEAVVNYSYPLDMDQAEAVKKSLEKKFNKKMHLFLDLDPDLLGGIRAEIGNFVIDGSVKKRFEDLRDKLMGSRVN